MSNINKMLDWMKQRQGKVSYSMTTRLGPNGYDCSSAVYSALIAGGFLPAGTSLGNTETLFNDLERNGWVQVQPGANGNYPAKKGDVFIWGQRGHTLGAAGHTGIFVDDSDSIIHCNYGYDGITINDHDTIWVANGCPAVTIYRYTGKGGGQAPKPSKPQVKRRFGYRIDDLQTVHGIKQIKNDVLVPLNFDWTDNGIAIADVEKINPATGARSADQNFKVGDYFAFVASNILVDAIGAYGDGNYFWTPFTFRHGGLVWLSAWDQNSLVYNGGN